MFKYIFRSFFQTQKPNYKSKRPDMTAQAHFFTYVNHRDLVPILTFLVLLCPFVVHIVSLWKPY